MSNYWVHYSEDLPWLTWIWSKLRFIKDKKRTTDGRLPSETICQEIMKYHKDYISTKYLAPYTTPVGPSGIGKSFTVAQLAYQHGVYVIYSSLAPEGSLQYPERSAIADILPLGGDKETQINFWRSHLIIALSDVDVCRRVGISPGAFYKLQTMNAYYGYQQGFAKRVSALFDMYKTRKTSQKFDQSWYANVNKLITDNTKSLEFWKRCLEKDNHNSSTTATPGKHILNALICMDEARALYGGENSQLFRSFTEALRIQFLGGRFFGILLDRTLPVVANFPPPVIHDPSQKHLRDSAKILEQSDYC